MIIKNLKLQQFRVFLNYEMEFSPNITVIYGDNAVGKTSIIEAVNCISCIKSFRTNDYVELINDSSEYFYLEATLESEKLENKVSYYCDKQAKKIKLNNNLYSKLSDFVGFFNVVCFSALDFLKLKGSANERRKMFDLVFCQISKDYMFVSNYYKKLLKDRNALLKRLIFENRSDLQKLIEVVSKQLVEYGNRIIEFREKKINEISNFAKLHHFKISEQLEDFALTYYPSVERLKIEDYSNSLNEDLKRGHTTIGPHRDDYIFIVNNKNVTVYGSQGQQRNAMLSVKLAMADLIYEIKKEAPTLLLDDVFSELDRKRQNALISGLNPNYQTIITTASISDLDNKILNNSLLVKIDKRSE
ncbi:MAG: DNA replication/repair protein RecF [Erysipelotrichaceae bacterium]|nr:DNA replication/repair protein RecF [Erysipelotrichaceae bacterium]